MEAATGGLEPYGPTWRPPNADWHREFLQGKVQRLHQGVMPEGPEGPDQEPYADFADGLLVWGRGTTRPVLFFGLVSL